MSSFSETLRPQTYYSVDRDDIKTNEDGTFETVKEPTFFHIVNVMDSKHRGKTMHTVKTADEVEATKTLVMEAEFLDKFSSPDMPEPANNGIRVFTEADAEWVVPETIATFDEMAFVEVYPYGARPGGYRVHRVARSGEGQAPAGTHGPKDAYMLGHRGVGPAGLDRREAFCGTQGVAPAWGTSAV